MKSEFYRRERIERRGSILAMLLLGLVMAWPAWATQVLVTANTIPGVPSNAGVRFHALDNPVIMGTNFNAGPDLVTNFSSGSVVVWLTPDDYAMTIQGVNKSVRLRVFDTNVVVDATALVNPPGSIATVVLWTAPWVPLSALMQGGAANGQALVWNGTNWMPGAVVGGQATNSIDLTSGTLTTVSSNAFLRIVNVDTNGVIALVSANGFQNALQVQAAIAAASLPAGNLIGTIADARLSSDVTTQGNTFNAAGKLVQLNSNTELPASSATNLYNYPLATRLSPGILPAGNTGQPGYFVELDANSNYVLLPFTAGGGLINGPANGFSNALVSVTGSNDWRLVVANTNAMLFTNTFNGIGITVPLGVNWTNKNLLSGLYYGDSAGGLSAVTIGSGLTLAGGALTSSGGLAGWPAITNLQSYPQGTGWTSAVPVTVLTTNEQNNIASRIRGWDATSNLFFQVGFYTNNYALLLTNANTAGRLWVDTNMNVSVSGNVTNYGRLIVNGDITNQTSSLNIDVAGQAAAISVSVSAVSIQPNLGVQGQISANLGEVVTGGILQVFNQQSQLFGPPNTVALVVTNFANTSATFNGNTNAPFQLLIVNWDADTNASGRFVAQADNGDLNSYHVAMGIRSSKFTNAASAGFTNDAYLYALGGKSNSSLWIGTFNTNSSGSGGPGGVAGRGSVFFFTGTNSNVTLQLASNVALAYVPVSVSGFTNRSVGAGVGHFDVNGNQTSSGVVAGDFSTVPAHTLLGNQNSGTAAPSFGFTWAALDDIGNTQFGFAIRTAGGWTNSLALGGPNAALSFGAAYYGLDTQLTNASGQTIAAAITGATNSTVLAAGTATFVTGNNAILTNQVYSTNVVISPGTNTTTGNVTNYSVTLLPGPSGNRLVITTGNTNVFLTLVNTNLSDYQRTVELDARTNTINITIGFASPVITATNYTSTVQAGTIRVFNLYNLDTSGTNVLVSDSYSPSINMVSILQPGVIVTNGETLSITVSNNFKVDQGHALYPLNATASRQAMIGADGTLTNAGMASAAAPINADGSATTFTQVQALAPGTILTNGGTQSITQSNNFAVDQAHFIIGAYQERTNNTWQTANYALNGYDTFVLLSGAHTATMPDPTAVPGVTYWIQCASAGTNAILPHASETFNGKNGTGLAKLTNTAVGNCTVLKSNGTNWWYSVNN